MGKSSEFHQVAKLSKQDLISVPSVFEISNRCFFRENLLIDFAIADTRLNPAFHSSFLINIKRPITYLT